jgi:hypothetical protein
MKVRVLAAHLAAHLNREIGTFVELHRALREGFTGDDDILPDYLHHDSPELFGEAGQKLVGKPGRGGGIEPDPLVITLLTIASLIDAPLAEVAVKTIEVYAAEPTKRKRCPLTRRRFFGEAFAAILTDKDLAFKVDRIDVSHDSGEMLIIGGDEVVLSRFNCPEIPAPWQRATRFIGSINSYGIIRLNRYLAGDPDFTFDLEPSKTEAE